MQILNGNCKLIRTKCPKQRMYLFVNEVWLNEVKRTSLKLKLKIKPSGKVIKALFVSSGKVIKVQSAKGQQSCNFSESSYHH